jgi:hypothetical protein
LGKIITLGNPSTCGNSDCAVHHSGYDWRCSGVVELDEERAALHAVVVVFAVFEAAHPPEFDVIEPGIANFLQTRSRRRRRLRTQIFLDERQQRALPVFAQLGIGDALVFLDSSLALVVGEDVGGSALA